MKQMNIGLIDIHTSGHHLTYASRLKRALEAETDHDVSFITLSATNQSRELFDTEDVLYLDSAEAPPIEERDEAFASTAETTISGFFSSDYFRDQDVVHFLYADTILGALWRHCPSESEVRVVGELNGTFFHRGTLLRRQYIHEAFLTILASPLSRVVDAVVPDRTAHEALWEDLYAYRCLKDETFDTIVVHSADAREYLSHIAPNQNNTFKRIPYPAPENFGLQFSQREARQQLDFSSDSPVLLFFGSMRGEKGITFLLDTLQRYQGPPITMVFAGPPVTITREDIESFARWSQIDVFYELGFIDTPELYYRAADAVILPYRRRYGKERPSQLFQEVVSSHRPVIVPDYGTLGRLTEEWELGTTFEQDSPGSLLKTVERFATGGIEYSPQRMEEYSHQHSYRQVAIDLSATYAMNDRFRDASKYHAPRTDSQIP